jgi:hypothetical protein
MLWFKMSIFFWLLEKHHQFSSPKADWKAIIAKIMPHTAGYNIYIKTRNKEFLHFPAEAAIAQNRNVVGVVVANPPSILPYETEESIVKLKETLQSVLETTPICLINRSDPFAGYYVYIEKP